MNFQVSKTLTKHRDEICRLLDKPLNVGDVWCLVEAYWFKQWERYVGCYQTETEIGSARMFPRPIDNGPLLDQNSKHGEYRLQTHLLHKSDYILIPIEAWLQLKEKFGIRLIQHEICRNVVHFGMPIIEPYIEIYPLAVDIALYNTENITKNLVTSRTKTFGSFLESIQILYKMSNIQKFRLLMKHTDGEKEFLNIASDVLLQDSGLHSDQKILIDLQDPDGIWKSEEKKCLGALTRDESNQQLLMNANSKVITSECIVCQEEVNYQKFLSCGGENGRHSLCEVCVKKIVQSRRNGDNVECPQCRIMTDLPDGDATKLETKFLIELVCESCSKEKMIEELLWCTTCQVTICGKHYFRMCAMKKHKTHDCNPWENNDVPIECLSFLKSVDQSNVDLLQKIDVFCTLLKKKVRNKVFNNNKDYSTVVSNIESCFGVLKDSKPLKENSIPNFEKKLSIIGKLCKSVNPSFSIDIKSFVDNVQRDDFSVIVTSTMAVVMKSFENI